MRVTCDSDVTKLQCALNALTDWQNTWKLTVSVNKCSILSIGKSVMQLNSLHIADFRLPVHSHSIDLGITITNDLKPREHINTIVTKAHQRANAILRCFTSRDWVHLYVVLLCRPLVEHNSVVWSPFYQQDIDTIERVQRRFTKRLPGLGNYAYTERLNRLGLHRLVLNDDVYTSIYYGVTNCFWISRIEP